MSHKTTRSMNVLRRAIPSRTNTGRSLIWALTTGPSALATDAILVNMTRNKYAFRFIAHSNRIQDCSDDEVSHKTKLSFVGPELERPVKIDLTKKLFVHYICKLYGDTLPPVSSFPGPGAVLYVATDAPHRPQSLFHPEAKQMAARMAQQ